ncbi:MAG: response regulator [Myxococcaceae bacterium]|jgi:two-component system phosphate regulon response regulator PhoB|nr:response regulator [Myxococcaceae bacterium]
MTTILIVDDEADLASLVEFNLKQAGLDTAVALTGEQALQLASRQKPDLVLLDLMLPDISGRDVCRKLRANPQTRDVPIVMLTARGEEADRVQGFEVGADDYVTKPFSPRELVLRVKAILRRAGSGSTQERVVLGPLELDLGAHRAYVGGGEVELTALEFKLLHHLMSRPGRVQTREQLLSDVWGITSALETRTVDTHVMRLREKLGEARDFVETVRGVGYRMADPGRAEAHA